MNQIYIVSICNKQVTKTKTRINGEITKENILEEFFDRNYFLRCEFVMVIDLKNHNTHIIKNDNGHIGMVI